MREAGVLQRVVDVEVGPAQLVRRRIRGQAEQAVVDPRLSVVTRRKSWSMRTDRRCRASAGVSRVRQLLLKPAAPIRPMLRVRHRRPGIAAADVGREIGRHVVDPLDQGVLRRDQFAGDRAGIHAAGAHALAAGEERRPAPAACRAVPSSNPSSRTRCRNRRSRDCRWSRCRRSCRRSPRGRGLRRRQRGQVDHAAAELAGKLAE